jgi:hypothetical protein
MIEASGRPFDASAGFLEPRQERQARKEWYEQPHRKIRLHAFARRLFLSDPEWRPVFEEMRQQWLTRAASAPPDKPAPGFLQAFAASFELSNYRQRKGDSGETVFEYVPPAHLAQRDPERVRRMGQQEMIASALAACHGVLTGEVPSSSLTPEDLRHRLELLCHLDRPEETRGFVEALAACCALAAVLVEFHRDWLRAHPDEEATCTVILLQATTAGMPALYHEGSDLPGLSPNGLAACALPTLWKDSPRMRRIREALARLVLSGSYATLRSVMLSAARYRDSLGGHFQQLEWLVQSWAVARHLEQRRQYCSKKEFDLVKWCRQHAALCIRGRLPCPGNSLPEVARLDPDRLIPGHHGHTDRRDTGIDIETLLAGYAWASDLSAARSAEERKRFITIHRQILDCAMTAFRADVPDDQADFYGPYEDEKVLVRTIASILLQLADAEDALQFWHPIMELAPKSRFWGMSFVSALSLPCLEHPDRVPKLKRVWRELLRVESNFWSEDDPPTVDLLHFLSPYLERWANISLRDGDNSLALIHLLRSKAAPFLRCDGLLWLGKGIPVDQEWEWENREIQDAFAGLLVLLAEKHGPELKSRTDVHATFLAFATRLAALQNSVAVELLVRMNRQA